MPEINKLGKPPEYVDPALVPGSVNVVTAGGTSNVRVMRGMEGLVQSMDAVRQEIVNLGADIRRSNEAQQMFAIGQPGQSTNAQDQLNQMVRAAISDAMRVQGVGSVPNTGTTTPTTAVPPANSGNSTPPTSTTNKTSPKVRVPRQPRPGEEAEPGTFDPVAKPKSGVPDGGASHLGPQNWDEGRQYSLGQLRQDVATGVSQRISEWQWGEPVHETTDSNGNTHYRDDSGKFLAARAAATAVRRQKIAGAVKGGVGAMARGESVAGGVSAAIPGLAMGALRFAGIAGAAYTAGSFVTNKMIEQRAANAEYQSVLGGSNFEGFGERARERMFGIGQRISGVMSSEDAQKLYQGVAATGMNRSERGNAQDFAVQNYKSMGMGIEESMQAIKIAANSGASSLNNVGEALRGVTKAAREAGVNAEEARQKFMQNWQTINETVQGPQAAAIAGAQTRNVVSLGRQAMENIDTSGQFSSDQMWMMAAENRMNPLQLQEKMGSTDSRDQLDFARIADKHLRQGTDANLTRKGRQILDDWNRAHPNGTRAEADVDQLRKKLIDQNGFANTTPEGLMQVSEQLTGVRSKTAAEAATTITNAALGNLDQSPDAQKRADAAKGRQLSADELRKAGSFNAVAGGGGMPVMDQGSQRAYDQYLTNKGLSNNTTSPIIQSLLDNKSKDNIRVRVQTENGKQREVSLEQAIRDFGDQVASGKAVVQNSKNADDIGRTLSDVTGMGGQEVDLGRPESSEHNKDLNKAGKDVTDKDPTANREKQLAKASGRVVIDASPQLASLLRFSTSGNVDMNSVKQGSDKSPGSRDTGNVGVGGN